MEKKITTSKLEKRVVRITIQPFIYAENWHDRLWFYHLLKHLLVKEKSIIGLGMRENDFYHDSKQIIELRKILPDEVNHVGIYKEIDKLDARRFKAVSVLDYSDKSFETLLKMWTYFENFQFFQLDRNIDYQDVFNNSDILFKFKGILFILENYSNFLIGKTLENTELRIDLQHDYMIPNLEELINYHPQITP